MRVWPGYPYPLGATWDGEGVNFALFSEHATAVDLSLFEQPGDAAETARVRLPECTDQIWHGYLPDARPGQLYGYRVQGPYAPAEGHRFNPAKLLIDPYAKAISGGVQWSDALFGYRAGDPQGDLSLDSRDSAGSMPKCVVIEGAFTWGDDRAPQTPWNRTVIYECHVKGMTTRHPDVPAALRGTYLGLATDPIIDHLKALHVTAVELMPVHHAVSERRLVDHGLTNYWGYNSVGYFAPDPRFATASRGGQVTEFKSMVKRFHRAGIEVILDVVYNHTAEGDETGPTLSLRGIDNVSYYRLDQKQPRHYVDFTGCGNSLNVLHPRVLQLIMDSLRYWVLEMHVDGFRFDLAAALARELHQVNSLGRFFEIIKQDPVISQVKLIAEPWDLGEGGYQIGNFPVGWAEWNGRYRDTVRRLWRGDDGQLAELGYRLSGSSDLYASARTPHASINFVTSHDGFTLADLVSYDHKHNEANGDHNRDGTDANWSCNWGAEGPTDDGAIRARRARMARNFLATLAFSQGVPMISHGDELGRTQRGNNNAYCQDSEVTWVDWELDAERREVLAFARRVFGVLATHPVLRRRSFFRGHPADRTGPPDVTWLKPDGAELADADWHNPHARALGMLLPGAATDERDRRGRLSKGETVLLLLNAGDEAQHFALPHLAEGGSWVEAVNTNGAGGPGDAGGDRVTVAPRSLVLLERRGSA
jgi:isoamylase